MQILNQTKMVNVKVFGIGSNMQEHISFCDRLKDAHWIATDKTKQSFKNHPVRTIASTGFAALVSASFAVSKEDSCATVSGCKFNALIAAGIGAGTIGILLISATYAKHLVNEMREIQR